MASQTKSDAGGHAQLSERIYIDGLMGGILTPRVIERLVGSGLTAINLTAVRIGATIEQCLTDIAGVREIIDSNSRHLQLVTSAADIRRAKAAGRVGIIIGMPIDMFTPFFAVSRMSGWTAHILEQYSNNRLIRPRAEYIGPSPELKWVPVSER